MRKEEHTREQREDNRTKQKKRKEQIKDEKIRYT